MDQKTKRPQTLNIGFSEVHSPPMTHASPHYTLDSICVYSILIHTGKGGGGELTTEGAMLHKAVKNTNMADCISTPVYKLY